MTIKFNGVPIDQDILIIDEEHNSIRATIGYEHGNMFFKEFHGDQEYYKDKEFINWCHLPKNASNKPDRRLITRRSWSDFL